MVPRGPVAPGSHQPSIIATSRSHPKLLFPNTARHPCATSMRMAQQMTHPSFFCGTANPGCVLLSRLHGLVK